MFKGNRGRLRAALTTLATTAIIVTLGATTAQAVPPGYQSGWRAGTSDYAKGCHTTVFYGRDGSGRPYAFAKTTNPACAVQVTVIPTAAYARRADSGWGSTVGALVPDSSPQAMVYVTTVIPAFNWTTRLDSWAMW